MSKEGRRDSEPERGGVGRRGDGERLRDVSSANMEDRERQRERLRLLSLLLSLLVLVSL
jgi:hypothetical protein